MAKAILLSTYVSEFKKFVINFPFAEELDESCNSQSEMDAVLENTIRDSNLAEYTLTMLESETELLQEAIEQLGREVFQVYENLDGEKPDEDFMERVNRREEDLDTRFLDLNKKVETVGLSTSPSLFRIMRGCRDEFFTIRKIKQLMKDINVD